MPLRNFTPSGKIIADLARLAEAIFLLPRRLAKERLEVTEQNRPYFRELVEAGLMIPLHSFARGNEGAYQLTKAGVDFDRSRATA